MNKPIRLTLKILWLIFVFFTPTALTLGYYLIIGAEIEHFLLVWLVSALLVVLIAWKSPRSLFALSLGALSSLLFVSIVFSILGVRYWGRGSGMFSGMELVIWMIHYVFPLTILSLIIAISTKMKIKRGEKK